MKICFWGNISGALNGKTEGGGELQIAFIAKALARAGHEVVIVDYTTREEFTTTDGIKVYTIKNWHKGIRVFRTITHRIGGLYSTLKEQNADIYYCRIRDFRHIIAYMVSKDVKGKFILHMASDLDAMDFKERFRKYYATTTASLWWFFSGIMVEIVYPWLLRHSDLVLVQHTGQKKILLSKNIKPMIFYNIIDLNAIPQSTGKERKDFIYVGWFDKRKGSAELFELIQRAPSHTFKIIGPPRDKTGQNYYERLRKFPNVRLLGKLSHFRTLQEIADSKALINTSNMEGFPNVFIEAWAYGIPVISLNVDPGNVIEDEKLGVFAHGDINRMVQALDEDLCNDDFARRSTEYIQKNHALNESKIREIEKVFSDVKNGKI
jgi:glycosyltransferase involved in cell wall biosynthesis